MGMQSFQRYGDDVIIVWDAEDPASDSRLEAGVEPCRGLAARRLREGSARGADLAAVDQAILGLERCVVGMDEIATWARTVETNGQKILKRVQADREALQTQISSLREHTSALRAGPAAEGE
jgi:hypothetical protein